MRRMVAVGLAAVTLTEGAPKSDPQVTRFYYLRYFDTVNWRSLVVGDQKMKNRTGRDANTKPVAAYRVFENRRRTT